MLRKSFLQFHWHLTHILYVRYLHCTVHCTVHNVHCTKNYLDLRMKTNPVTVGAADATVYVCLVSGPGYTLSKADHTYIYCWIRSSLDRLGFYAEIQLILGTECPYLSLDKKMLIVHYPCVLIWASQSEKMPRLYGYRVIISIKKIYLSNLPVK